MRTVKMWRAGKARHIFLVVLALWLEVGLRMLACGADAGCILSLADKAAVATLPPYRTVAVEEVAVGKAREEFQVASLMFDLDSRYHAEGTCNLGEALLVGNRSKCGVEQVPLLAFALGGCEKILLGGAYATGRVCSLANLGLAPFEELEEYLGMLLLLRCRLVEYGGNLFVTLLAGSLGKECVAVASLRLAGKCFEQILLGACSFDTFHCVKILDASSHFGQDLCRNYRVLVSNFAEKCDFF